MEKQKVLVIEEFNRITNDFNELGKKYTIMDTLNDDYHDFLGMLLKGIDKPLAIIKTDVGHGSCINVAVSICSLLRFDWETVDVRTALKLADTDYFKDFTPFKLEPTYGTLEKEYETTEEKIKLEMEVSPRQLGVMNSSLELYARLLIGQFDEFDRLFWHYEGWLEKDRERAKELLIELQKIYFPDLSWNASYGIGNKLTAEQAKIAYEIYKTIRHALWQQDEERKFISADSNLPLKVSEEERPIVKILEYKRNDS